MTKISSIIPFVLPRFIVFAKPIELVETPTENEFDKFNIVVLKPDTETESLFFNSMNGKKLATTSSLFFHTNTESSNLVKFVSILEIPIPTISSTIAEKPDPSVLELSNSTVSPTL